MSDFSMTRNFLKDFVKRPITQEEGNKYKEIFDYFKIPVEDQTYENFILLCMFDGLYDWSARKSNGTTLKLMLEILYPTERANNEKIERLKAKNKILKEVSKRKKK